MASSWLEVNTWHRSGNRLVHIGDQPVPVRLATPVSTGPASYQATVPTVDQAQDITPPVPYPTYTDYPVRDWVDIDPAYPFRNLDTWDGLPNVGTILRSLTYRCYVRLPRGFRGKIVDFVSGGTSYGVYAPNCVGIWGYGPHLAIMWLQPMSSTKADQIPQQTPGKTTLGNGKDGASNPNTLMRLGPNGSASGVAVHNYGWSMCGTDQPPQISGEPHNYSGYINYWGRGSTDEWLFFCGIPGDWNSPPGETFQYAMYYGMNNVARYIEVDGRQIPGPATGGPPTDKASTALGRQVGSAVGNNGTKTFRYEYLNVHDAYIGGPTTSGAGGPDGNICYDPTFVGLKSWYNANHGPHPGQYADGKTFGGFNVEGTGGTLTLDHPDFRMSNPNTYQKEHLSLHNMITDLRCIVIEPRFDSPVYGDPVGSWPNPTKGCFIFKISDDYPNAGTPNAQVTPPEVTLFGRRLEIKHRYAGQGWPTDLDPYKHMIWVH